MASATLQARKQRAMFPRDCAVGSLRKTAGRNAGVAASGGEICEKRGRWPTEVQGSMRSQKNATTRSKGGCTGHSPHHSVVDRVCAIKTKIPRRI